MHTFNVSRPSATRIQVGCPDQGCIAEGVVHGERNCTLFLRTRSDIGHPSVTDLETTIASRKHKEESKVSCWDIRGGESDDDSDSGNGNVDHYERRSLGKAVRKPCTQDAECGSDNVRWCCEEERIDGIETEGLHKRWKEIG